MIYEAKIINHVLLAQQGYNYACVLNGHMKIGYPIKRYITKIQNDKYVYLFQCFITTYIKKCLGLLFCILINVKYINW